MNKHVDINVEDYDIFANPRDLDGDEIWPPDDAEFVVHPDSEVGLALREAIAESDAGAGKDRVIQDFTQYLDKIWREAKCELEAKPENGRINRQ
ncbi:MAG: hypothetical protein QM537_02400 [Candidatus Symbiobacter sp.]|nr:hypothetical protein [Candidatus Symbiobacter sp.]